MSRTLPSVVCFCLCSVIFVLHLFWLYGVERALFPRIYVAPVSLALLVFLEYFAIQIPEAVLEALRDAAERHELTFVPLRHLFTSHEQYALGDGIHPDPAGHRRIAAAIADALAPPAP